MVNKPKGNLLLGTSRNFRTQSRNSRLDCLDKSDGLNADTKSIISHLSRGRASNFTPKAKDQKTLINEEIEKLKLHTNMTSFTPKDHSYSNKQKLIYNQTMKQRLAELDRLKYPTDYKKRINEDHLDEIQS